MVHTPVIEDCSHSQPGMSVATAARPKALKSNAGKYENLEFRRQARCGQVQTQRFPCPEWTNYVIENHGTHSSLRRRKTQLTSSCLLREASFLRMTVLPRCGSALWRLVTRGSWVLGAEALHPGRACGGPKSPAKGYSVFLTVLRPVGVACGKWGRVKTGPVGLAGQWPATGRQENSAGPAAEKFSQKLRGRGEEFSVLTRAGHMLGLPEAQ